MIYSIPVAYTNTIYSRYVYKNAGGDLQMMLSAVERYSGSVDTTRCLLAPCEEITKYTNIDKVNLELKVSRGDLKTSGDIGILLYELTKDWTPGISLNEYRCYKIDGVQEGSTWKYANINDPWSNLGGDFDSAPIANYTISYRNIYDTIRFDITNHTNSVNGYLLKLSNLTKSTGIINIYSSNTHTLFRPKYVAYIQDYTYTESSNSNLIVSPELQDKYIYSVDNVHTTYAEDDIVKFNINITPKSYSRDWTERYHYYDTASHVLTSSIISSYAVYDVSQLEKLKVVTHSEYTRISCDGENNYFNFDMSVLLLNRYYQILIKIGNRTYLDLGVFKIV